MNKYNELNKQFYDEYHSEFDAKSTLALNTEWITHFCNSLPPSAKVLDAGCGTGRDAMYFVKRDFEVFGFDLSPKNIERAQLVCPQADFHTMDIADLSYANTFFDGIWCLATMVHIPRAELREAMLQLHRILKPNGILFVSFRGGSQEGIVEDPRFNGAKKFYSFVDKKEVETLATDIGFSLLKSFTKQKKRASVLGTESIYLELVKD